MLAIDARTRRKRVNVRAGWLGSRTSAIHAASPGGASSASTGDYERGMAMGARRISHVVDPRTGLTVEGLLGTSVVARTATEADGLSTALYVLGFEGAQAHARAHHEAALIVADGARIARTPEFAALEIGDEKRPPADDARPLADANRPPVGEKRP